MLDLKFLTDEFKLDGLDLSSLKIPKNIIYMVIAFKLINNLDKILPQNRMTVARIPKPRNNSSMSLFVLFLIIGGIMILSNNLLDKINISLMSCGVNAAKDYNNEFMKHPIKMKCPIKKKCPMKEYKECPMKEYKECPMKEYKECPMKEYKECPMKEYKECPMKEYKECPMKEYKECPMKKYCPLFSNDIEEKLKLIIDESEKTSEN